MVANYFKFLILILFLLGSCASDPKITVDPKSVSDMDKYQKDLKECKDIAMNFENKDAQGKSALLGGAAVVGTTAAILATGGMYLLPSGAALFGGGGAALGSGISKSKQNDARQKIWSECMNKRGYEAYTG